MIASARTYRLTIAYCLFITVPLRGDCLTLRAMFDTLFAPSIFKNLVISSMRLHGMFHTLEQQTTSQEKEIIERIIAPTLDQFECSVRAAERELRMCRTQDIEFLLIVLDRVACQARQAYQESPSLADQYVQRIRTLQESIDRLA